MKAEISEDLKELIPKFLENRKLELLYARDYVFQKRYTELKSVIHGLKGVLGSYGFTKAYEMTKNIEKLIKEEEYKKVKDEIENLNKSMENIEITYVEEEF